MSQFKSVLESFNVPLLESAALEILRQVFGNPSEKQEAKELERKNVVKALEYARSGIGQDGTLTRYSLLQGITQTSMEQLKTKENYTRIMAANRHAHKAQSLLYALN